MADVDLETRFARIVAACASDREMMAELVGVIERDNATQRAATDALWLARLARGSSWPGEMAERVERAAGRVIQTLGTDADRRAEAIVREVMAENEVSRPT